jgi:uncharacterized protein YjiS (DUF1127 family)
MKNEMTVDRYTTQSLYKAAFERLADIAREYRIARIQRIALINLLEMDANRLGDLGLNAHDVVEALDTRPIATKGLDARRSSRAAFSSLTAIA